ncbi:unnamed protein product, partial [Didymodactylos carnosus]
STNNSDNESINEYDIMLKVLADSNRFNPAALQHDVDKFEEYMKSKAEAIAKRARRTIKEMMYKRHDEIIERFQPTTKELSTKKDAQNYIETHLPQFKTDLRKLNTEIENELTACIRIKTDAGLEIDWNETIKITEESPTPVTQGGQINYNNLANYPFYKIYSTGEGRSIAGSDKYFVYQDNNDLCVVDPHAKYRIVIPVKEIEPRNATDGNSKLVDVVDICWCRSQRYFIVLTDDTVFTLDPNTKRLSEVEEIQLPKGKEFWRCTRMDNIQLATVKYMASTGIVPSK